MRRGTARTLRTRSSTERLASPLRDPVSCAVLRFLLLCAVPACNPTDREGHSALLLTLDTTRADALSCYGNPRPTTPALDALAAEGVLYERAHTIVPLTLPAHASMLTGLWPFRHGLRDNGPAALSDSARSVAEAARESGLRTAAFVSSVVLDDSFGLDQGFERYDVPARRAATDPERRHAAERPARATVDAALEWLASLASGERFFLWVHLYDPHFPYTPPADLAPVYADNPYLGEVAGMDRELGRLLDALRERGALEHVLVLAVADHGEALGDHGEPTHGATCYEATLRVPLIARFPGGARAGEKSRELVSVADVAPTLAESLDLAWDGGGSAAADGRSFWNARIPEDRGLYFESYHGYLNYGWSPLSGWLDARGKYLHSPEPELFDLAADPRELRDLVPELEARGSGEPERYRRAIAEAAERPALPAAGGVPDEEALAELQGLGYVARSEPGAPLPHPLAPSDLPSPRSQLSFLARHARAQELGEAGQIDRAAEIYEELLRENPRNFFVLDELASYRLKQGRAADAVALLQELVQTGPQRGRSNFELGLALRAAGRLDEALDALERAVELTGGRGRYLETLTELLESRGRAAEAAELRERYRPRGERP